MGPGRHRRGHDHDRLTALILAAGRRIGCDYALEARPLTDGRSELIDGVHRWAVAGELGITSVPVDMKPIMEEAPFAWP